MSATRTVAGLLHARRTYHRCWGCMGDETALGELGRWIAKATFAVASMFVALELLNQGVAPELVGGGYLLVLETVGMDVRALASAVKEYQSQSQTRFATEDDDG